MRAMTIAIPGDDFENGHPYTDPVYGLTVIFKRAPDEFVSRAGPDGYIAAMRPHFLPYTRI